MVKIKLKKRKKYLDLIDEAVVSWFIRGGPETHAVEVGEKEIQEMFQKLCSRDRKVISNTSLSKHVLNHFRIENYGGFDMDNWDKETANCFFDIVVHDVPYARLEFYVLFRKLTEVDLLSSSNFSLLIDKILVDNDVDQYYGTQFYFEENSGEFFPYPIYDQENLIPRRNKFGLSNYDEYVKSIKTVGECRQ